MKKQTKEKIKNIIIVLLILAIISMLVDLYLMKNSQIPTGNVDVFDINCSCDKNSSCLDHKSSIVDKKSSNINDQKSSISESTSSTKEETSSLKDYESSSKIFDEQSSKWYDKYSDTENLNVYDPNIHWSLSSELRIFTNPTYVLSTKMAPGYQNAYTFMVRNNNEFNVKYSINFIEDNTSKINMVYRLKDEDGNYIKGNKNTWVNYSELKLNDIYLDHNEKDVYILEWLWKESNSDLEAGLNPVGNYQLSIEINGVEV